METTIWHQQKSPVPQWVNCQGPSAHSKPSLRQPPWSDHLPNPWSRVESFITQPGNQTWLAAKSTTRWTRNPEKSSIHDRCHVWFYRKALNRFWDSWFSHSVSPLDRSTSSHIVLFLLSSSANGWRKPGNTGHAWVWKRNTYMITRV